MSCVSDSRIAPVSGSCRLSTSVPRSPREIFLIPSTADGGSCFGGSVATAGLSITSVDIAQIPSIRGEVGEPRLSVIRVHVAVLTNYLDQGRVHIGRHARGVAAHV